MVWYDSIRFKGDDKQFLQDLNKDKSFTPHLTLRYPLQHETTPKDLRHMELIARVAPIMLT